MDDGTGLAWQIQQHHWARHLRDLQLTAEALHASVRAACAAVTEHSRRHQHNLPNEHR